MTCSFTGCASTSAPTWRCWAIPTSISFTAGIGENDPAVRRDALAGLEGSASCSTSGATSAQASGARRISADDSPITVLVVPTNEELAIARDCASVLAGS